MSLGFSSLFIVGWQQSPMLGGLESLLAIWWGIIILSGIFFTMRKNSLICPALWSVFMLGKKRQTNHPLIRICFRRTDKIGTFGGWVWYNPLLIILIFITRGFATSQLFEIEEYMEKVEMWFRRYEMSHNSTKRQIYLSHTERGDYTHTS